MDRVKKFFFPGVLFVITVVFFWQVFLKGLLPIPSDTIVGLYHPFRDLYAKEYPRGIPFKNFLITDPIRQQIPWKNLSVESIKNFELPSWNPYVFTGTPLLANFQSSSFYPLNILLILLPFQTGWSLMIISQILLGALFMFFYLKNQKLDEISALLGSIAFSLSGFFIAWLEWNNIIHTALWLPLILLSADKIFSNGKNKISWQLVLGISLTFSFFAGHLQFFFYEVLFLTLYILFYIPRKSVGRKTLYNFSLSIILFLVLSSVQLIPTLKFILLSAREIDQSFLVEGWFIPLKHLVQFLIPDFFGNPTTLNYFGSWNYGEFMGYIGVLPILFAIYSLIAKDRKVLFFSSIILICLIFATKNPISELPFRFEIPMISSSQPTRLIYLISFSLSVMAAVGFNQFMKANDKKFFYALLSVLGIFVMVFLLTVLIDIEDKNNLMVARRNMLFPFAIFIAGGMILSLKTLRSGNIGKLIFSAVIIITLVDLFRFGWKFTPFTKSEYFYPQTKTISFLKDQKDKNFRIMALDSRILPPNISSYYKIQSIEGYDPLYLKRYGELITAAERGEPDIDPPFGFNRIITPHAIDNKFVDLLNVKYLLSLTEIDNASYKLVFEEGETKVYENQNFLPRAFFADSLVYSLSRQESIEKMFEVDFRNTAVVEASDVLKEPSLGTANIVSYSDNEIIVQTENEEGGFLVLLDSFYPTWKAYVDGDPTKIYITNYNFRGIAVPAGRHTIMFRNGIL